jgi:hypothetical protein
MMVARFVRAQAWWRLDTPGVSPIRAARCVVALLDAAGLISGLPESHPHLQQLARANCFTNGAFDPGPAALAVVRGWQLADDPADTPQDLLAALTITVSPAPAAAVPSPAAPGPAAIPSPAAPGPGAIPATPLPPAPGLLIPEPAYAPDTVVFDALPADFPA